MDGRGRGVLALCLLARVSVASEDFNEASTSTGTGAIQDYAAWDAAQDDPMVIKYCTYWYRATCAVFCSLKSSATLDHAPSHVLG